MAKATFNNIKISGISAVVPKNKINNLIAHENIAKSEKEKTIKLTGINEYRTADPDICTSDLCQKAAEQLFAALNISPDTIDAILFVSLSPDYRLPSTACLLQDKLSCPKTTLAFDVNLGCSGYVYGLYLAATFIQGGHLNRVLLLCGDTQTKLYYEQDKSLNFLLGDAGTATLVEAAKNVPEIKMSLMTDGSRFDKLIIPAGGCRNPSTKETRKIKQQLDGQFRSQEHLYMDGMEIFNFSVTDVVSSIKEFMADEELTPEQIDYLFLHQANKFMIDKVARKLGFSQEKVPYSLDIYGNTSSASIPLTIVKHFTEHQAKSSKHCLLSGFGVGLSWGVIDIVLDNLCLPTIIEL
jgi:3-oxoacyl-[acyl-carrier-protein] synthase-3